MSRLFQATLAASLLLPFTLVGCGGGGGGSDSSGPETGATIKVSFQLAGQVVDESDGVFTALVRLSAQAEEEVSVDIGIGAGTADLSDFQLLTTEVTFAIGETVQPVVLEVFADSECEGQETIRLLLGGPVNAEIGALSQHDITLTGSVIELEPNGSATDAVTNGPLMTLGPGLSASICGELLEVGNTDDFDVYMADVSADSDFTLELFNDDPNADYIILLTELNGAVFLVVDANGAGLGETAAFSRLAGGAFLISVSMVDPNGAGNPLQAEYEVFVVGATPSPLAPPAPDDDRELAELIALDADWRALVEHAAAREEPLFARR